jgi:leucine dehydrogenase
MDDGLWHERVLISSGQRSRLPIVIAVHSTALGQAAGGCRMWGYASWRDGLADALRLSEAMTLKSALAGLPLGGGKSVIPLSVGTVLESHERRDVMLDLGDAVESLGGLYGVAEDVGTTAEDMLVASERTRHAYCLPEANGGTGETSEPTAVGVYAALEATCERLYGSASPTQLRCTVIGLGQTGSRLARRLAQKGARLVVADIDPSKRQLAEELGATWMTVDAALAEPTDILIPAALGGLLTQSLAQRLDCRAVVGPANNQLADESVADVLASRGILWAPDFLVNAGGVIYGGLVEAFGKEPSYAMSRVEAIGTTLRSVYEAAASSGTTPYAAALELARARVAEAGASGGQTS